MRSFEQVVLAFTVCAKSKIIYMTFRELSMVVGMDGTGWGGAEWGGGGGGGGGALCTLCAAAQTALECFPECTEALAGTETT